MERQRPADGEHKIYSALEKLFNDGVIDGVARISWKLAYHHPEYTGMDFLITRKAYGMPIESKSSTGGAREHHRLGNTTPVIIAGEDDIDKLSERLIRLMDYGENFWRSRYFGLFEQAMDLSTLKPDLFTGYGILFRDIRQVSFDIPLNKTRGSRKI